MQAPPGASAALAADRPTPAPDTQGLWRRFKESGDMAARRALVESYLGFARYIAARCYALRVRDGIGFNDYMQLACLDLIDAVDRFHHDNGKATFETYASHRIRGAVLNGLIEFSKVNAQIEARRQVRRERLVSLAQQALPEDSGARLAQLADMATGLALGLMLDDLRIYQSSEGTVEDNCYADAEMRKLRTTLARLVNALPERERLLISEHYFKDKPFDSIAASFGITKGRMSQLHKRALTLLQSALNSTRGADWSF
jgi:RNA polymerase sigma factor for flagellar operon FliA